MTSLRNLAGRQTLSALPTWLGCFFWLLILAVTFPLAAQPAPPDDAAVVEQMAEAATSQPRAAAPTTRRPDGASRRNPRR